ncbi:uncharacterized protein LOC9650264 isoform X2 [Selaginella moellendorffii]|nr:uncharacterized protein LOC9650264 isoform X2 [Selaginella moellendorffii]|eukprot:XP_002992072.2 uncharacterized protein LOC9650264 isoform X2 [Selaginella moellendorffii]
MRLYAQVRAMQGSLVMQAQRISQSRRLHAVISSWQRLVMHARKSKTLRKAEALWDRRILRKSFSSLASRRAKSLSTKKLVAIAGKHWTRTILLQTFEFWLLTVHLKKCSSDRLAVFMVLQRSRIARVAFGAWKLFKGTLSVKSCLERRVRTFFVQHRLQKSWRSWRSDADSARANAYEATEFSKLRLLARSLETWSTNAGESVFERAQVLRIEQHRMSVLLHKSFRGWLGIAHVGAVVQRRLTKAIVTRTKRILLFTFIGWRQHAKNKREVSIWRKAMVVKQQLELRLRAFDWLKYLWTRGRLLLRLKSRHSSRIRLAILKVWFLTSQNHKACRQNLQNIANRSQIRQLKDNFQQWLSFVADCRRAALLKDGRVLQARLELSQEDLQNAQMIQAVMSKTITSLEKEKATMVHCMDIVTARTPPWTSGFLNADLRWSASRSPSGTLPSPRVGHTAVSLCLTSRSPLPSHLVVTGGYDGQSLLKDILVYHVDESMWRIPELKLNIAEESFRSVQHHTACVRNNKIIFFGGFNGAEDSSDLFILEFSEDGNSCELSQPEYSVGIVPGPMSQHTSCVSSDDNHMIVFGGYRSNVGHLNELWMLDLRWMDWHLPDYYRDPPAPRRGHGAVIIGTKMYVFGGYDGKTNFGDFYTLDLGTMEWNQVEHFGEAPTARRHHAMAAVGKNLVLYGGYNGVTYLDDVYSFDTETSFWKRWKILKSSSSGRDTEIYGRSMHAMVSMGQRFVIVGGIHEYGTLGGVVYLENGAAVDGLALQKELTSERCKVETLQQNLAQYEGMVHRKVADLALAYSKIAECQAVLKEEVKARKAGAVKQQILIQKLKKVRKKSTLW